LLIEFKVQAQSLDELCAAVTGATQGTDIRLMDKEAILHHLRARYAPEGYAVKVEPVDGAPSIAPEQEPAQIAKPRRAKKEAAPAPILVPTAEEASRSLFATDERGTAQPATMADVIAALDAYARGRPEGHAGARIVMQKVTGKDRLVDVPEAHFVALIEALTRAEAA
jgi:hypothetical protein